MHKFCACSLHDQQVLLVGVFFLMSFFDVSQHIGYSKKIFKNLLRGLGTQRPFWPLPLPRLSQKPKFVLFFWKASLMLTISEINPLLYLTAGLTSLVHQCVSIFWPSSNVSVVWSSWTGSDSTNSSGKILPNFCKSILPIRVTCTNFAIGDLCIIHD